MCVKVAKTEDLKSTCCCCSVTMSCLFATPMDCSTPGFPVLHYFLEFAQTCLSSRWCHPTISSSVTPFSSRLQPFPASWSFLMSQWPKYWSFSSIRWPKYWSFSYSVSPSNEYSGFISYRIDWFDLLAVQGTLSRVFSSTAVQKHQFFSTQPSLWSNFHIHIWLLEKQQLWVNGSLLAKWHLCYLNTA